MSSETNSTRQERMSVVAKAPADALQTLWTALGEDPDHVVLRAPEIGTVMVRGRAGGTGSAFNLGEITVTRCSVRLTGGAVGHGYVQGRDKGAAHIAALTDAMAEAGDAARIETAIIAPLRKRSDDHAAERAAKAAATRVEFFTMTRGENG